MAIVKEKHNISNGRDIIQLRNLGTIIRNDSNATDSEGIHYVSALNTALWNQVFSEGIVKIVPVTRTELRTVRVPNTNSGSNTSEGVSYTPTGRENRYAAESNEDIFKEGSYNHQGKEISNHNNRKTVSPDFYKINKPVEIEAGDSVVYKIEVYNNKSVDSIVTVGDDFSAKGGPQIVEIRIVGFIYLVFILTNS